MSDRSRESLTRELRALAADLAWPPTPDLTGRHPWATDGTSYVHFVARGRWPMPAWLRPALAAVLALAFAAVAIDPVRAAIGDVLGIAGGERIERSDHVGAGAPLSLGEPVTLDAARARAGFPIVVPTRLGPPRQVRFGGDLGARAVSLVYADTVLTEIPDASAVFAVKRIGPGVRLGWARVAGSQAAWIARGPRVLVIPRVEDGRAAARRSVLPGAGVLLWDREEVAMRLETRRGRAEALAIARSLRRAQ